jgi:hypothetical protein
LAVFIAGAALGLALSLVPALASDAPLPWDTQGPVFAIALLVIGMALGFLGPGQAIAAIIGVFIGQLPVLLGRVVTNPETSELWLVSAMLLAGYTFVGTGIGATLGSALRRRFDPAPRRGDRRSA